MYSYDSSATLTTDRLHYKLQTRPLIREGAPRRTTKQLSGKRKENRKIWSEKKMGSKGVPDTKTDRLTECRSQHQLNSVVIVVVVAVVVVVVILRCEYCFIFYSTTCFDQCHHHD
jgi:hypothetical protein